MTIQNLQMLNLPSSLAYEKALLSQIIINNNIMTDALAELGTLDFYFNKNQKIFYAMKDLYKKDIEIDIDSLQEKLGYDTVNEIGMDYITGLALEINVKNCKPIIKELKELSKKRDTIEKMQKYMQELYNPNSVFKDVIGGIASDIFIKESEDAKVYGMNDINNSTLMDMYETAMRKDDIRGMRCGIADLDYGINGFEKKQLVVIGGRPSMGKTTLLVNIFRKMSLKYKTFFFSMEQSKEKINYKILSQDTKIDTNKIMNPKKLDMLEFKDVYSAMQRNNHLKLRIDERGSLNIAQIESVILREKQKNGLDIVFIDYLQIMDKGKYSDNLNLAYSEITRQLQTMTKKYDICIVLLSQLSRASETRSDHRPMMSDLRESGGIEQSSDKILLLYRDEYYNKENSEEKGILEVIIAKNKEYELASIKLDYKPEKQLIQSLIRDDNEVIAEDTDTAPSPIAVAIESIFNAEEKKKGIVEKNEDKPLEEMSEDEFSLMLIEEGRKTLENIDNM